MDLSFKTIDELQRILGERLRALRLDRDLTQQDLAETAGVSLRSITNLERGAGSSVETLLRVLKGLDATDAIETLAPTPMVSPLAMLNRTARPRRARRRKP